MKRLLIDMDGVLSDIYGQYIKYEQNDLGITQSLEDLAGKPENLAFVNLYLYINSVNFFYSAMPINGSIEAVRKLNTTYKVFIVSSATQFPLSLTEKINWLAKYFPFISWQQIVLCGSKEIAYGDIMIDDHFKNLDNFNGQTILFTQPHNIAQSSGKHIRVNDWQEIENLLL
jgi:5'-nucleotidase